MQRNFLKSKTSDSQIRLLQDTWHTVYQNTYDEGLKFLIKGLDFPVDSLDDVIDKILKKIVPFKRRLYTSIFKEINNIDI